MERKRVSVRKMFSVIRMETRPLARNFNLKQAVFSQETKTAKITSYK